MYPELAFGHAIGFRELFPEKRVYACMHVFMYEQYRSQATSHVVACNP